MGDNPVRLIGMCPIFIWGLYSNVSIANKFFFTTYMYLLHWVTKHLIFALCFVYV